MNDDDIDAVFNAMPGGPSGFCGSWGYRQFAHALLEKQAATIPAAVHDALAERARQDEKWGGPGHDDSRPTWAFVQLIQDYAAWARVMANMNSPEKARRRLVQVAALALAAVQSIDRKHPVCSACGERLPKGCGATLNVNAGCLRVQEGAAA